MRQLCDNFETALGKLCDTYGTTLGQSQPFWFDTLVTGTECPHVPKRTALLTGGSWAASCQTQDIELKFETFMLHVQSQKGDTKGREGCESGSLFIPSIHQLIKIFVLRRGMLDSRLFTVNYLPTRKTIPFPSPWGKFHLPAQTTI